MVSSEKAGASAEYLEVADMVFLYCVFKFCDEKQMGYYVTWMKYRCTGGNLVGDRLYPFLLRAAVLFCFLFSKPFFL